MIKVNDINIPHIEYKFNRNLKWLIDLNEVKIEPLKSSDIICEYNTVILPLHKLQTLREKKYNHRNWIWLYIGRYIYHSR